MDGQKQPPFVGTTMNKYKKQMDWRRNKVRDLFFRGYSQYEISNTLHISQSTISRDINFMKNKTKGKKIDPNELLMEECEKTRLVLNETIKELWKIIDSPKAGSKEKTKSINLMLNIIKEFHLILDKEISIMRSKQYNGLLGNKLS